MTSNELIEQQWIDIVPPEAAAPSAEYTLLVVGALLLLAATGTLVYMATRPKQRARRNLRGLLRGTGPQLHKPVCFQIARQLRSAFNTTRLTLIPVPADKQVRWDAYVDRLTRYRYDSSQPSRTEIADLVSEAIDWLGEIKQ
jgi:hypothetical protein